MLNAMVAVPTLTVKAKRIFRALSARATADCLSVAGCDSSTSAASRGVPEPAGDASGWRRGVSSRGSVVDGSALDMAASFDANVALAKSLIGRERLTGGWGVVCFMFVS